MDSCDYRGNWVGATVTRRRSLTLSNANTNTNTNSKTHKRQIQKYSCDYRGNWVQSMVTRKSRQRKAALVSRSQIQLQLHKYKKNTNSNKRSHGGGGKMRLLVSRPPHLTVLFLQLVRAQLQYTNRCHDKMLQNYS